MTMRPAKSKIKRFKLETKYPHHRSEGLTRRRNRGTRLLVIDPPDPGEAPGPAGADPLGAGGNDRRR